MSLSTIRKQEMKSQSITLPDLLAGLSELVEWETFGGLLGVPIRDIDRIKAENSSIHSMVLHLLDYLVNHIKDLSWKKVTEALEKIPKERDLAEKLSKIHLQPQVVNSPQKIISLKDKEDFALQFNGITMKFARLVFNIKKTLKNEADFDDVLSFATTLQVISNPPPVNIRELFDCLQPHYCFMKYKILEVIVFEFIKKTMEKDMEKYREAQIKWLESTTIKEFKEAVEKAASTESVDPSPNQCLIVLRLEGEWLKVTLNNLSKLLEYLFGKESSILTRLRIKEGSVVVCLFASQSAILTLLTLSSKRYKELAFLGILSIQFGNILLSVSSFLCECTYFTFEVILVQSIRNFKTHQSLSLIRCLLEIGADPNKKYEVNVELNALMMAALENNTAVMSLLVEYGADVHKFVGTYSPIHCAARCGHVEAIEFLLKNGVSIDHCNESIRSTPLMVANIFQEKKSCSYLIKHGATLDFQNNDGKSALAVVCEMGSYSMAKLLLEGGANPNLQSNYGSTPLSTSCYEGHHRIVKLLLDFNADPNIQMIQFNGLTPLMLACYHENHNIVKLLLQAGVYVDAQSSHNFGRITALHIASTRNDTQLVKLLLNANADVNVQTINGITPMYTACVQGNKEMLQMFLEKKADPNLSDKYGKSSLYAAIEMNSIEIVTALLETGADPNMASGKSHVTPLQYACTCSSDDIIHLLLKANANPNVPSTEGYTPLSIASVTGRIKVAEMLLSKGADIELQDTDGWTPIFHAAAGGRLDVIRLLLKHGAKIKKDKFGKTIESIAAKSKRIEIKDLLQEATKQKDEVTVSKEEERKDEPITDEEVLRIALTTPVEVDTGSSGETTKPSPLINEDDQQSTDNSYFHYPKILSFISSIKQQYENSIKRLEHQIEAMQSIIAKQQKSS